MLYCMQHLNENRDHFYLFTRSFKEEHMKIKRIVPVENKIKNSNSIWKLFAVYDWKYSLFLEIMMLTFTSSKKKLCPNIYIIRYILHRLVVLKLYEVYQSPIIRKIMSLISHLINIFQGFTLEFYFESNKFFNNTVLTKQYQMRSEPDEADPFSFEGPEIVKCKG